MISPYLVEKNPQNYNTINQTKAAFVIVGKIMKSNKTRDPFCSLGKT